MPGDIQIIGNRFTHILHRFPCAQRILMVTDGSLGFGTNAFGLSEFVQIVRDAGHTVHTAHRSGSGGPSIPGAFNFATAATAVTVANYDQLWLFGFSTTPLTAAEQTRIAAFMRDGGGVFATGDHETIGRGMGANLPRVRGMRNWSTIPMTNPNRHDTVVDAGSDGIKQFDDQADAIAQRIYPVFFSNGGAQNDPATWAVHPVLRHPSGAVDALPDHAHESECLAPTPVAGTFAGIEEWPLSPASRARIPAVVVARSISAGRFIVDARKPPVDPRCFGAISAWDGDPSGHGRIVCDATWHHFVNINLNGSGSDPDASGVPRAGLYVAGSPTPEYDKIKRYYLNTVRWLAPRNRRYCLPWVIVADIRFHPDVIEWQPPHPHPCPWDPLFDLGRIAEEVLVRRHGRGMLTDVVDAMLATAGGDSALAALLDTSRGERVDAGLLPVNDVRRVVLGALVNRFAEVLPEDERKLEALVKKHDAIAVEATALALADAERASREYLGKALAATQAQLKALDAAPVAKAGRGVKPVKAARTAKPVRRTKR